MTRTLKALSALLNYPSAELVAARREIEGGDSLRRARRRPRSPRRSGLFSRILRRSTSSSFRSAMSIFSTRRGACRCISSSMSMARAAIAARQWSISPALYEKAGLHLTAKELPDYLPAFLEYASTLAARRSARPRRRYGAYSGAARGAPREARFSLCGRLRCHPFGHRCRDRFATPLHPRPSPRATISRRSMRPGRRPPSPSARATPWAAARSIACEPRSARGGAMPATPQPEEG